MTSNTVHTCAYTHVCSWFPHESNEYGMRDQFKRQIKCLEIGASKKEGKDSTGLLLRDREPLIQRRASNTRIFFVALLQQNLEDNKHEKNRENHQNNTIIHILATKSKTIFRQNVNSVKKQIHP